MKNGVEKQEKKEDKTRLVTLMRVQYIRIQHVYEVVKNSKLRTILY